MTKENQQSPGLNWLQKTATVTEKNEAEQTAKRLRKNNNGK